MIERTILQENEPGGGMDMALKQACRRGGLRGLSSPF